MIGLTNFRSVKLFVFIKTYRLYYYITIRYIIHIIEIIRFLSPVENNNKIRVNYKLHIWSVPHSLLSIVWLACRILQ